MSLDLLTDTTTINVGLGSAALGVTAGALGCFATLRRQGLVGDAVAHATLPGVCLAFLLTGSKAPLVLMLGAAITGLLGMGLVALARNGGLDVDSGLATALSVFFGAGLVLLTVIQKDGGASQAGLDRFLFGQAAALVRSQVVTIAVLGAAALVVCAALFKELRTLAFDPGFARSIGLPVGVLEVVLTALLVVSIVIGLNTVGVILMAALIVAPPSAARQWTDSLPKMVVLAGVFGGLAGVVGAWISVTLERAPTGPAIVMALALISATSIAFGSARGLVWRALRRRRARA